MRAAQMFEEFPVVGQDSDALVAVRLLAERRLPGLVVIDGQGVPVALLPASQVVQFLVPTYVQEDPSLAGVLDESMSDHLTERLAGRSVLSLLPHRTPELPRVEADDTVVEVAAVMARTRCPMAAVMDGRRLLGVVTASRLLQIALGDS